VNLNVTRRRGHGDSDSDARPAAPGSRRPLETIMIGAITISTRFKVSAVIVISLM
jgi:hypothetical protein